MFVYEWEFISTENGMSYIKKMCLDARFCFFLFLFINFVLTFDSTIMLIPKEFVHFSGIICIV